MARIARASLFAPLALAAGAAQANVVGGGSATIAGGGDDMTITYSSGGAGAGGSTLLFQPAQECRVVGSSDGAQIQYPTPGPAGPGRCACLSVGPAARALGSGLSVRPGTDLPLCLGLFTCGDRARGRGARKGKSHGYFALQAAALGVAPFTLEPYGRRRAPAWAIAQRRA
jgi:hypothetical protein